MSATRYVGQASKRSPQPKAEVSTSSVPKGSSRGNDTGVSSLEQNRNDHIRGNQGAGLSESVSGGGAEKKKAPSAKPARKANDKDSGSWNTDGKSRSRDAGLAKLPSPTATIHLPVVATRGISSNSSTSSTHSKADNTDGKTTQSHSARGKAPARQSTKGHRSNQTPARDPSPSSSSVGSSANEYNYSSSASIKDSNWSKAIYPTDKHHGTNISPTSTLPGGNSSTNQKPLYEDKDEFMWSTSQESNSADWAAEVDLEEQLLWSSSTDDDKINYSELPRNFGREGGREKCRVLPGRNSQKNTTSSMHSLWSSDAVLTASKENWSLRSGFLLHCGCAPIHFFLAWATLGTRKLKAAQQTTPTTSRPLATSAYPTPTASTSTSSYISSQSWQEVTRPTR